MIELVNSITLRLADIELCSLTYKWEKAIVLTHGSKICSAARLLRFSFVNVQ